MPSSTDPNDWIYLAGTDLVASKKDLKLNHGLDLWLYTSIQPQDLLRELTGANVTGMNDCLARLWPLIEMQAYANVGIPAYAD